MRKRTWLWTGVAGVLAGLAGACSGTFVCSEDSNCDLSPGGRCVAGTCEYSPSGTTSTATGGSSTSSGEPTTAPTSGATVATTSVDTSTSGATVGDASISGSTTATTTDTTTGEPVDCEAWEVLLDEPGKATGVIQLPNGDAVVVGVSYAGDPHVLAKRLLADDGETVMMWGEPIVETVDDNYVQDVDVVARVLKSDAEDVLVAYSIRNPNENGNPPRGPYLARVAVEDGKVLARYEKLGEVNRSLHDAVMPDPDNILFAGHKAYEAWYTRAQLQDDLVEKWAAPITPINAMNGLWDDSERARAIAVLSDAAVIGGTWDAADGEPGDFHAWLRLVDYNSGQEQCTCVDDGAGVLALAVTSNGQLFFGGFHQTSQSALWLARAETVGCPLNCHSATVISESGQSIDTEFEHAERVRDAVLALHPLANGGVVAGGTLDGKPWLARYTEGGQKLPWNTEPSMDAPTGAVLAIAVSDDDRCVTVAGSENYHTKALAERTWWVRRLKLE